jgi:FkbM family methyltransferase
MSVSFFRRARIASEAVLDIENWREVLPRAAVGETVSEIRLRNGFKIVAPAENNLWPIFSDIWYHAAYTKYCAIPKNGLVVDVGANVGVFSLFASRVAALVYALEPASSNFSRLISNISKAQNIVPLNLACAAQDGRMTLALGVDAVTCSLKTIPLAGRKETVEVVSLSTLFERYNIRHCDFLKLDCEGSEFDIILQSDPSVFEQVNCIVMEYHDHLGKQFSHEDLFRRLVVLGFAPKAYSPNGTFGMLAASRDMPKAL